jgi:hypothetical protein
MSWLAPRSTRGSRHRPARRSSVAPARSDRRRPGSAARPLRCGRRRSRSGAPPAPALRRSVCRRWRCRPAPSSSRWFAPFLPAPRIRLRRCGRCLAVGGQLALLAGAQVDHVQVLVAHEGHVAAFRRDLRIEHVARGDHARGIWLADIDQVQVAGDRHQQLLAVRRPAVARGCPSGWRCARVRGGLSRHPTAARSAPGSASRPGDAWPCPSGCIPTGRAGTGCPRGRAGRSRARRPATPSGCARRGR